MLLSIMFVLLFVFFSLRILGKLKPGLGIEVFLICVILVGAEAYRVEQEHAKSIPVMTFTVKDKIPDGYVLVLQTDKGYFFEQPFVIDTYHRYNVGDKISYRPSKAMYHEVHDK